MRRPRRNSTARSHQRHLDAPAVPVRPDVARQDQRRRSRLPDVHLSHVAQYAWFGLYGDLDVAIVEVAGIREDGLLIPSASIGNNKTWLERAKHVILEVNSRQPLGLDGMHDVYYGTALPPHRKPIPLTKSDDRIGEPYLRCPADKIVAIVETDAPDRSNAFSAPDATSKQIALQLIDFLRHEVKRGRLPENLLPLQSGVGNITNAVLAGSARPASRT